MTRPLAEQTAEKVVEAIDRLEAEVRRSIDDAMFGGLRELRWAEPPAQLPVAG